MTDTPASKAMLPMPLTAEELAVRLKALGGALKAGGCGNVSIAIAERVVDAELGGRMQNIRTAIPALAATDARAIMNFVAGADRNKDNAVDTIEGEAILMAGVNRAVKAHATDIAAYLKDLVPDAAFFKEVDEMHHKIQATSCSVSHAAPPRRINLDPQVPAKPKGREK